MVEPVNEDVLRSLTPKPRSATLEVKVAVDQGPPSEASGDGTYATDNTQQNIDESRIYMSRDGRRDQAGMSGGNNRRQSHPNQSRRSLPRPNGPALPQYSPDSIHAVSPSPVNYHGPPPLFPVQYNQRSGYVGQYTMSPQPAPMGVAHSSPQYSYSHGFQGVPDGSMMPQNIHASYQSIIHPPVPMYPYQRHSSENSPPNYPSPAMFPPGSNSTPPVSPHSAAGPQSSTPTYANPGQFHSLRYPSPMPSQYAYPTQSFPASPVYPSQYGPSHYHQHFTPSTDDVQGSWYYVPHASSVPSRQYSGDSSYAGYQMNYSPVGHQEPELNSYSSPTATPSQPLYSMSPLRSPNYSHTGLGPPSSVSSSSPSEPPPQSLQSPKPGSLMTHPPDKVGVPARRPYHPNPPAHRSEWVMWSGNVPSDATHDELWRFFTQPPSEADENTKSGVMSIFLISRSNCAFVNFESEEHLHVAIERFNGVSLRPHDPRCPRLVCRVRKKDDDLKAGVGGQRGVGMHTKWVRDNKGKDKMVETSDQSDIDDTSSVVTTPSISVSSDDGRPVHKAGSGSSYASTNSSLLTRYFPKRYFILKSLSQYDLDLSVQKGLWATQKHNEGILDQAYRTSKEIYLIFGVNKSGEFYGYARMAGPVRHGAHQVSWASRTDSSSSRSSRGGSLSPVTGRFIHESIPEEPVSPSRVLGNSPPVRTYFPARENRLVEASPQPVSALGDASPANSSSLEVPRRQINVQSAPAELGEQHKQITLKTPTTKYSLDQKPRAKSQSVVGTQAPSLEPSLPPGFKLNEDAPLKARKRSDEELREVKKSGLKSVMEEEEEHEEEKEDGEVEQKGEAKVDEVALDGERRDEAWGESFKVEWLCTERLPFYRTRHIRNPWNHDREVKVSRDGTELEPSVGQQLIDEWTKLATESQQQPQTTAADIPSATSSSTGPKGNLISKRTSTNQPAVVTASSAKGSRDR